MSVVLSAVAWILLFNAQEFGYRIKLSRVQGLVLHSSCQIVENGGDMRGVTGGEVHPLFPAPG